MGYVKYLSGHQDMFSNDEFPTGNASVVVIISCKQSLKITPIHPHSTTEDEIQRNNRQVTVHDI